MTAQVTNCGNRGFYVYCLEQGRCHYIGATTNPCRRIRQHNSELRGGACRTKLGSWELKVLVCGFRTWKEALQFEWAFKHITKRCRCLKSMVERLYDLMDRERWTSNAPPASEIQLDVQFDPSEEFLKGQPLGKISRATSRTPARRWKKRLHGVQ